MNNPFFTDYNLPYDAVPFSKFKTEDFIPAIEKSGLILADVDVWRKHYYYTLLEWHKNFMNKKEKITKLMGEKFTRIYRIYLWGCAQSFLNDLAAFIDKIPSLTSALISFSANPASAKVILYSLSLNFSILYAGYDCSL